MIGPETIQAGICRRSNGRIDCGGIETGQDKLWCSQEEGENGPPEGMRMELLELMTAKSLGGVRKERRQKHLRINFTLSCTMPIHEMRERYLVKWS